MSSVRLHFQSNAEIDPCLCVVFQFQRGRDGGRRVWSRCWPSARCGIDRGGRRVARRNLEVLQAFRPAIPACDCSATSATGARGRRCAPALPRPARRTWSFRMRTWNTIPPSITRCLSRRSPTWRTSSLARASSAPSAPGALLLARRGQPAPHDAFNMATNLNLSGHGDLLQTIPPRAVAADPHPGEPLRIRTGDHRQGQSAQSARLRVPISYYGRTYSEGKKIGWRDGMSAPALHHQIQLLLVKYAGHPSSICGRFEFQALRWAVTTARP